MNREYIRLPKTDFPPDSSLKKRELTDGFWVNLIHHHLLKFYKEYDRNELKGLIDSENAKVVKKQIETLIKDYMKTWFEKYDKKMFREGLLIDCEPKVKYNDPGFYDIKFQHSDWVDETKSLKRYYSFECKNLTTKSASILEYVYNGSKKDGGIYRYFNGKYAQAQNFGGMLGFVLAGDAQTIKNSIIAKMKIPFDITPEGDLLGTKLDSIEDNKFTFDTEHKRSDKTFTIHHLLFDLK